MSGSCLCGCGEIVTSGRKYRRGHWAKTDQGALRLSEVHLKGSVSDHGDGYLTQNAGIGKGNKLQHRMVMEQLLGRPLLDTEVVHHNDENRSNNTPDNLTLCKDEAEHRVIHLRLKATKACGNPDWRKCKVCKQWDDPKNLVFCKNGDVEHRACGNKYRAEWAQIKKQKNK